MNDIVKEAIEYANKFADEAPKDFKELAFQTALQYFLTQNETKTDEKSSKANKKSRAKLTPHDYLRCLKLTVFPE